MLVLLPENNLTVKTTDLYIGPLYRMEASTSDDQESLSNTSMTENVVLIGDSFDFSSPWHFSDVVLVVGDTKLHVHKCILSMWSPVFKTMFSSHFVESNAKEIPLPGKRADEVEVLMKFIYSSGTKPKVTEENYQFLLQLAEEYQMDRVKSMCSEFLVDQIQESHDCLGFFKLAEQFHLDDVTETCYEEVLYKSSTDLEESEHFNGFEPELKVDICMRVIKELERTLEEYVTTCSDLVKKVFKKVYEKYYENIDTIHANSLGKHNTMPYENPNQHVKVHDELQLQLRQSLASDSKIVPKNYNTKLFEFSCSQCIENVLKIAVWNQNKSYSILKAPIKKLYWMICKKITK